MTRARRFVGIFLCLGALAACGEKLHADRPTQGSIEHPSPANSLATAPSAPSSTAPPPAPPSNDPVPQTLTSTGEACTSDKECALVFEQGGCCSCGYVAPLTVKSRDERARDERARESLPSKHCELVHCAKPPCRGPGIEDFRPICINHSCGAVRR